MMIDQPGPTTAQGTWDAVMEAFCQRSLVAGIYKTQTIVEFLFRCRKSNRPDPQKKGPGDGEARP